MNMPQPYPPPPRNSCFVLDYDDSGWPRVSWNVTNKQGIDWTQIGCFIPLIIFWGGTSLGGLLFLLGQAAQGESVAAVCYGFPLLMWFIFGWGMLVDVFRLMLGPTKPASLTLTNQALIYFAGITRLNATNMRIFLRRRLPQVIDRRQIDAIGLDRIGERQRLCVDIGADRIEIGAHFKEPEREWLATVLGMWSGIEGSQRKWSGVNEGLPPELPSTNIKPAP
jgi:hypothetical protein